MRSIYAFAALIVLSGTAIAQQSPFVDTMRIGQGHIARAIDPMNPATNNKAERNQAVDSSSAPRVKTAAMVPPPAPDGIVSGEFESRYECAGTILHQFRDGELESPVTFWFGVGANGAVTGAVNEIGPPLDLARREFNGQLRPRHDAKGTMVGGKIKIAWPYTLNGDGVQLSILRETFIRVGPRINGHAKIKLRTSKHIYVAGSFRFDPASHPSLAGLNGAAFVTANCSPGAETAIAMP